jgi:long-chain acyl-CoA synthetase
LTPPPNARPDEIGADASATILDVFAERVRRHPDRIALEELVAKGAPHDERLSWREWHELASRVGAALVRDGVEPGEAVAIHSGNRNLWPIAEIGVLMAGAVSVGVHTTSSIDDIVRQLNDCNAAAIIVDTTERLATLMEARGELPSVRVIVCEAGPSNGARWWGEWLGDSMAAGMRFPRATPDDVALLAYSTGHTGEPRGARITHRCIAASAASIRATLRLGDLDRSLSVLPYSGASERIFGLYTRIRCGMTTAHVDDRAKLGDAARSFEPTLFIASPSDFAAIDEALRLHERTLGGEERERWCAAIERGHERSLLRQRDEPVPDLLEARWRVASTPCRAELARMLGGNTRLAVSLGGALPVDVADYLDAAGLTVLAAYGRDEHPCIAMQRPDARDLASVGPPMPGTEVRVADDGELLVRRNALTFAGYLGKPNATRRAFTEDGAWLKTGKLAELGANGQVRILGPTKEPS